MSSQYSVSGDLEFSRVISIPVRWTESLEEHFTTQEGYRVCNVLISEVLLSIFVLKYTTSQKTSQKNICNCH